MHDKSNRSIGGLAALLPVEWIAQHDFAGNVTSQRLAPRAAIYARRSVLDPRDISMERQITECTGHVRSLGACFDAGAHLYTDPDSSGATMAGRAALKSLLAAARKRLFDAVVVEAVDRLGRDLSDLCQIHRLLDHFGIQIHVAHHGRLSIRELVMFGLQAQQQRERFLEACREGRRMAAAAGRLIGAWHMYGYDRKRDGHGWTKNKTEALVIRRAAELVGSGMHRNAVAKLFNAEGIQAPGSGTWTGRSFFRGPGESPGLLERLILKGQFVWRESNPSASHASRIEIDVPELAIIDVALFDRINSEQQARRVPASSRSDGQRFLSGILKCTCGASMVASSSKAWHRGSYRCDAKARRGTCDARNSITIVEADRRVLQILHDDILHPDHLDEWNLTWKIEHDKRSRSAVVERERLSMRVLASKAALDREDSRNVGDDSPKQFAARARRERKHQKLLRAVEDLDTTDDPIFVSAEEASALRSAVANLRKHLPCVACTTRDRATVERLRELLMQVVVQRHHEGSLTLRCRLAGSEVMVEAGGVRDPLSGLWIERTFPKPRKGRLAHTEAVLRLHEIAEEGRLALTDEEWKAVAHLFDRFHRTNLGARGYADAMIFLAATGLPRSLLPERHAVSRIHVGRIREYGIWPRLLRILEEMGSDLLKSLDQTRFADLPSGARCWCRNKQRSSERE